MSEPASPGPLRLGIDLGGTKIEAAVLDAAGRVVWRRRVPTPGGYEAVLDAIAALVREAQAHTGSLASIGVGSPGAISPVTGLVKNANSTSLIGHPLDRDLAERLGRPVVVRNDADCFALSEATDGAGAGAPTVFGVILGTGVGGGIVCHGRLLGGPNAIAGEWGHNPLPWPRPDELPGPRCYCGRRGCIEAWLSGPALARTHTERTGERLEPPEIVRRAAAGDAGCAGTLEAYEERLARALAHVINILDPHVIVLGGGLSQIERLYTEVPRRWGGWVFSDTVETALRPPVHGDASGVRGAAWLGAQPG